MSTKAPLDAGQFDRRVVILERVENQNALGEVVISYAPMKTVWAHVKPTTGRELFVANQTVAEASLRVFIRYMTGITEKHKVEHEGVQYDITHIVEYGRRDGLELVVKKP
jgi:SPP1 family predicted phage head-tail adaptor